MTGHHRSACFWRIEGHPSSSPSLSCIAAPSISGESRPSQLGDPAVADAGSVHANTIGRRLVGKRSSRFAGVNEGEEKCDERELDVSNRRCSNGQTGCQVEGIQTDDLPAEGHATTRRRLAGIRS